MLLDNADQGHQKPSRREGIRGGGVDLTPLRELLRRIQERLHPRCVWLFGSRARGDAHTESDWDLLVVVDNDAPNERLDLREGFRIARGTGVPADIIIHSLREFLDDRETPNTIAYAAAHEGIIVDER